MLVMKTEGRILDWMVAKCEGFAWGKNVVERYGDKFTSEPNWPIGSRFFLPPGDRQKDLHATKKNWDGWCESNGREKLALRAMYYVPEYSTKWGVGGPVLEREISCLTDRPGDTMPTAWAKKGGPGRMGRTALIAAMRCYVIITLGEEVIVPKGLESVK